MSEATPSRFVGQLQGTIRDLQPQVCLHSGHGVLGISKGTCVGWVDGTSAAVEPVEIAAIELGAPLRGPWVAYPV